MLGFGAGFRPETERTGNNILFYKISNLTLTWNISYHLIYWTQINVKHNYLTNYFRS